MSKMEAAQIDVNKSVIMKTAAEMYKNARYMRILDFIQANIMDLVNYALRSNNLFTHWMFHEDYPFAYVLRDINNDKIC